MKFQSLIQSSFLSPVQTDRFCSLRGVWSREVCGLIFLTKQILLPLIGSGSGLQAGKMVEVFFFNILLISLYELTSSFLLVVAPSLAITGSVQFSSVQLLSHVQSFVTPWTVAHQASLSITISWSSLKLMSIELVMSSNHLVLCHPLLLLPSVFPSFRVFSNESVLRIRWPKYWNFSFSISPSNEYSGLISFRID